MNMLNLSDVAVFIKVVIKVKNHNKQDMLEI